LGFGGVTSLGVPECCRNENVTRKLIIGTESPDFVFEKRAPLRRDAGLIRFVAFTQSQLAAIVVRKPKPRGDKIVNVLESPMVKAVHGAKPGCKVRVDLNQATGIQVAVPRPAVQTQQHFSVEPELDIFQRLICVTWKLSTHPHRRASIN